MRYEQMEVWQRSKQLSAAVYRELKELRDFGFKDQITRSALSIPSNIAEGFERYSEREKFRFASIAKGSCGEFATQTLIGIEVGYIPEPVGQHWRSEAMVISRMLGSLLKALAARPRN
ncbi:MULTISPECIES: four helix bundle protein [Modicisalibacter]|uniref:Four helix bundle protein n=1 Tax=Modicisalibacter tunisiensis TaxID=390637 RepID=A0ABS7WVA8_9GAMM|nr:MULTISPECIES: four helix bundle protein [Modicisalibacter]MBZ9540465.1 four helix bundle protein [Modicisalibacter tunisiensis]MBZ9566099.1 four helix bundle protein [Modicisalibacter tunisiensis]